MRIFPIILVILLCATITLGAVFSAGIFQGVSTESEDAAEAATVQQYMTASAWIYIIAALLIIAVVIMALKLLRETVPT